jgi:putative ABC transport system ATP-binding protein
MTPVAVCTGAARTFDSGRTAVVAVHGATCEIAPGRRIALTGRSGSGKTTLLHLLAGIDRPTAGSVRWPGLGDPEPPLPPSAVGVVFQGARLLPALDVTENVRLPLQLAGTRERDADAAALAALARLGLEHLARRLPAGLSGGQAQRVAVARAIVSQPRLLLADEPTGQLDHGVACEVVATLLDAVRQTGAALVLSTHDRAIADLLPDRWTMTDGRLATC